ncbi:hypothetical protein [Umezawaea sp.]|uniref:hypothetical protein n=1 Tax=Umezawaea sp. TaxID=1955258 RepID=UPI002ED19074
MSPATTTALPAEFAATNRESWVVLARRAARSAGAVPALGWALQRSTVTPSARRTRADVNPSGVRQSVPSQVSQRWRAASPTGKFESVLSPSPKPAPPLVAVRCGCRSPAYRAAWWLKSSCTSTTSYAPSLGLISGVLTAGWPEDRPSGRPATL